MGYIRETKLKKGGTRFQAEVRLRGYPTQTATFDRKTDAKAWIQKVEADIRCGRHQVYGEGRKHTLSDAIKRYRQEQSISVVKRGHLEWWDKELGAFYLQDIRPAAISERKQKLLTDKTVKGIIRSKSTCNRYLATLSHVLSICMKEWEWVSENPVRKIAREKEPRERTRFLTPKERQTLLDACKQSENPLLFTFVVLLLSTGGRYNEIRNLKWAEVDLRLGRIFILKSKNGDARSVPVQGLALELLRRLSAKSASLGYVFPSPNSNEKPVELRRAFRTAIKRSGLQGFRGHDARHDYATGMLALGLSLGEIGHLLGHRSVSVTKRYSHLIESRAIEAVAKMSEQAFAGVGNE